MYVDPHLALDLLHVLAKAELIDFKIDSLSLAHIKAARKTWFHGSGMIQDQAESKPGVLVPSLCPGSPDCASIVLTTEKGSSLSPVELQ